MMIFGKRHDVMMILYLARIFLKNNNIRNRYRRDITTSRTVFAFSKLGGIDVIGIILT